MPPGGAKTELLSVDTALAWFFELLSFDTVLDNQFRVSYSRLSGWGSGSSLLTRFAPRWAPTVSDCDRKSLLHLQKGEVASSNSTTVSGQDLRFLTVGSYQCRIAAPAGRSA